MAVIALGYDGNLAVRGTQIVVLAETGSREDVATDVAAVIVGRDKIAVDDRTHLRAPYRLDVMRGFHLKS